MPYQVDEHTGLLDYDGLERSAKLFRPRLLICGGSAYPREWDYPRFRKIADINGSYLMADIAHISGLVASGEAANPFQYCDIVTSTTHKTLRGPRSGIIFFRKMKNGEKTGLEEKINFAVFPGNQGGPHENTIAAVATALKQVNTPEFKEYCIQIKKNCHALCEALKAKGYKIVTDGSDNHLLLLDVRPNGLTGSKVERVCELAEISLNKNAIHGDASALSPGGVRIGTPSLTSRGFKEKDMEKVGELIHRAIQIAISIQSKTGKLMKDFEVGTLSNPEIASLKEEVEAFARQFPMPGFDVDDL